MPERKAEPLDEDLKPELKCLKLNIIDMVSDYIDVSKHYIPYLAMYEAELETLLGLPEVDQRKGLKGIANNVIALYKKYHNGGRNSGK